MPELPSQLLTLDGRTRLWVRYPAIERAHWNNLEGERLLLERFGPADPLPDSLHELIRLNAEASAKLNSIEAWARETVRNALARGELSRDNVQGTGLGALPVVPLVIAALLAAAGGLVYAGYLWIAGDIIARAQALRATTNALVGMAERNNDPSMLLDLQRSLTASSPSVVTPLVFGAVALAALLLFGPSLARRLP